MSYLLDTNVVSELHKSERRADREVRSWAAARVATDLYLSAVTVLEIELGLGRLGRRDPEQTARLLAWLEDDLLALFSGRVLSVDTAVARRAPVCTCPIHDRSETR